MNHNRKITDFCSTSCLPTTLERMCIYCKMYHLDARVFTHSTCSVKYIMTWNTYTLILGYDHFQIFLETNDDDDDDDDKKMMN